MFHRLFSFIEIKPDGFDSSIAAKNGKLLLSLIYFCVDSCIPNQLGSDSNISVDIFFFSCLSFISFIIIFLSLPLHTSIQLYSSFIVSYFRLLIYVFLIPVSNSTFLLILYNLMAIYLTLRLMTKVDYASKVPTPHLEPLMSINRSINPI